ncbi:hypothetical protein HUG10_17335 [Halorarum halophilum]|uniref:Uncharacterized protein n=1 Tax=Halorarum halophilum TaxID=2743090 RepID=A0A7D5GNA1_9EURY|nr:hypothetical protein [Halobaculum halophilum]QLG29184.1 hypothetical protein HUG10_17335 [Halobaculum halophilum]
MTDTLTEYGVEADERDALLTELRDSHGEVVGETDKSLVLALEDGHKLDEWAEKLNVDRDELAARMRELADEKADYNWGTYEPFVVRK